MTETPQNWSRSLTYSSRRVEHPRSLEELRGLVASSTRVRALGSRHSFSRVADTDGVHVSLDALPPRVEVDAERGVVTCSAGLTHAQLSRELHRHGLALPNLASLPHISVVGAVQTGTHGSGVGNPSLSAGVVGLSVVDADGALHEVGADHPDLPALVVGLGAFGVVHAVTQRVVPAFDVAQTVYQDLPWEAALADLEGVMAGAYSVSLFTRYDGDAVAQVWVKHRVGDPGPLDPTRLGAVPATRLLHPLPETDTANVTAQGGSVGASFDRLPHFRHDVDPGRGDEIQSEYLVPVARGVEALQGLRRLAPVLAPVLHVAEVRRVAPDPPWLSPAHERDSLALHFTWVRRPDDVLAAAAAVEEVLRPLGARPHWGKVSCYDHAALREAYPRLDDFAAVVERWDPRGVFANAFVDAALGREAAPRA